jgi:hypothetical protein
LDDRLHCLLRDRVILRSPSSSSPAADVVDVLATDVYQKGFAADDYEQLLALAGDKPVALGEVGRTPTVEILHHPVLE